MYSQRKENKFISKKVTENASIDRPPAVKELVVARAGDDCCRTAPNHIAQQTFKLNTNQP